MAERVYTISDLDDCLKFVYVANVRSGEGNDDSTTTSKPDWWPCLWFANAVDFDAITKQWNLCQDSAYRNVFMMEYMLKLPESSSCPVALLLGDRPPVRCLFDIPSESDPEPVRVVPLIDNIYRFNVNYMAHRAYIQAVGETLPIQMIVHEGHFPASKAASTASDSNHKDATTATGNAAAVAEAPDVTTGRKDTPTDPSESRPLPVKKASKNTSSNKKKTPSSDTAARKRQKNANHKPAGSDPADVETEAVAPKTRTAHSTGTPESGTVRRTLPPRDAKTANVASALSSLTASLPRSKATPKATTNEPAPASTVSSTKRKQTAMTKATPSSSAKKAKPETLITVECAGSKEIRAILAKGGYKMPTAKNALFCRPCGLEFASEELLRNDLCVNGVDCKCGGVTNKVCYADTSACCCWDSDDKWTILLWVRYNILRGPLVKGDVREIGDKEAWGYLELLGFHRLKVGDLKCFALPAVEKAIDGKLGVTMFNFKADLWSHLSRFGLPSYCNFDNLSREQRFELEYFLSSNNDRATTFMYIHGHTHVNDMELTAARPRRTPVSSVDTADEAATVVSLSSGFMSEPASMKKQKKATSTEKAKKPSTSRQARLPIMESPSRGSLLPQTSKNAQHVSPSTPVFVEEKEAPRYQGTDREKLSACLDALNSPEFSGNPTIANDKSSAFASNIGVVSKFLEAVIVSDGCADGSWTPPAALYVCGAPGLGKTSGVKWCCKTAVEQHSKQEGPVVKICELNASAYASSDDPLQSIIDEIAKFTHLKTARPQQSSVEKALTRLRDGPNKNLVFVVIDEIDALVSSHRAKSSRGNVLETLLQWAHNPDMQVAVIGISNCMNDDHFECLFGDEKFSESVTFAAYNENELKKILEARVGKSIFATNALAFIAKKVASSTGDARAALEMAKRAIQLRLGQINHDDSSTSPIVSIPHVVQSNKDEIGNVKDRIVGLPMVGKAMLCVLMTYAQEGAMECMIGELKSCVGDCLRENGSEDEMLTMDDFLVLLETLVESGLLLASSHRKGGEFRLSNKPVPEVSQEKIRLGLQLDEVHKSLEATLSQGFYRKLRETAKEYRKAFD